MAKKILIVLLATSLLSACASDPLRYAATARSPTEAAEREATAVTIKQGSCRDVQNPGAGGAIPLVAPLVGVAADFAVDLVAAELKRLKEGRNATWVATGETSLLIPNPESATALCLSISRGVLVEGGKDEYHALPDGLGFQQQPAFVLQTDLILGKGQPDKAASLTARPFELAYAETSAPIRGKNRKDVSVLVAFSGQTLQPGAGPQQVPDTKDTPAVLRLDFGRLQVGHIYKATLLQTAAASTSLPAAPGRTITAVVAETENTPVALDAAISAFDSNKSDLSAALKKTIADAIGGSAAGGK